LAKSSFPELTDLWLGKLATELKNNRINCLDGLDGLEKI
jgi:UDP-N-acetylmuramyl pentapeptide phosphotransferase/UDP-N-acetylglucosamine-1-phosphate transferase